MSTTSLQKMRKARDRAEAAALRMGAVILALRKQHPPMSPQLREVVEAAVADYRALEQAQRNRAAEAKRKAEAQSTPTTAAPAA